MMENCDLRSILNLPFHELIDTLVQPANCGAVPLNYYMSHNGTVTSCPVRYDLDAASNLGKKMY